MMSLQIETMRAYRSPWLGGVPQHSVHGRSLRLPWSTLCPFLRSPPGGLARRLFLLKFYQHLLKSERHRLPRLIYSHETLATICITSNIRGIILSKSSVSLQTISSATLSAKSKMRCNRSKRVEGNWSYLFRSFKTYKAKRHSSPARSVVNTNLKRDTGKTKNRLCDWVQLEGVSFHIGEPIWEIAPLRR